jgi:hypothetical protein
MCIFFKNPLNKEFLLRRSQSLLVLVGGAFASATIEARSAWISVVQGSP